MNNFITTKMQWIRLSFGQKSELSQSRARILIVFLTFVYLATYYHQFGAPGDLSWYATVLVSVYLGAALLWDLLVRRFPAPSVTRKTVAIAADAAIISSGIYLAEAHGVVVYSAYFWMVAGNGLRFGTRYLLMAAGMAALGLSSALLASPYWRTQPQIGIGLLVGMFLISALLYSLLHRLQEASQRLKERALENERMATHDHLTGLANRALFLARLEQELAALPRRESALGVLFIDLDGFKRINDLHGHARGDRVLVCVAERLRDTVRRSDTVARVGGDEFAILLTNLQGRDEARTVAQAVLEAIGQPHDMENNEVLAVTPSIGLAIAPEDGCEAEILFHVADMAMYAVKRTGKCAVGEFKEITPPGEPQASAY